MVKEEEDGDVVHEVGFRKGGGLASESADALAQGAVESLHVIGWPALLALLQQFLRPDPRISLPDIGKTQRNFVGQRNTIPQHAAGAHAPTADGIGHNLPGAAAQGQPQPLFVFALQDE